MRINLSVRTRRGILDERPNQSEDDLLEGYCELDSRMKKGSSMYVS